MRQAGSVKASISFDYGDIKKFQHTCYALGDKVAIKAAQKAAQKGSNVVGRSIRAAAPKKTGALRSGFKKKKEKSRLLGKVVYDYAMDKAKNDIFQKPIKNVGMYGGKKDTGYYPASVEYGFLTSAGGGTVQFTRHLKGYNGRNASRSIKGVRKASRKVEGTHFTREATEKAEPQAIATMKKVLNEELDKAWQK